ncbi:hypothetical protein N7471_004269 [Penicillium samsonianum]|uniref:uncharacterized protein n=1 Tax=Penicillium samsonianum TaxID=1882272 RepID=UPI002549459D|nr:uncharacterized protein N7471_004269 [Penicillium samsonianum]KAJ6137783.1 hypothetical protein N7471_004269 [Penicillium samsonianum]
MILGSQEHVAIPFQKRLRGIRLSACALFFFGYLFPPSLIALRISISTLTAGYLIIIASDDNIGVYDVAIDRFLYSDGFHDASPWNNEILTEKPIDRVPIHTHREIVATFQLSIWPGSSSQLPLHLHTR